jgi:hypothetical protein
MGVLVPIEDAVEDDAAMQSSSKDNEILILSLFMSGDLFK